MASTFETIRNPLSAVPRRHPLPLSIHVSHGMPEHDRSLASSEDPPQASRAFRPERTTCTGQRL